MPVLPEGRSLYVQQPLNTISVAYQQSERYVADQAFPTVPVALQGGQYWVYPKGDWFRTIAGVRAPATESVGAGWDVTTDTYYAYVYAVHKDVDDQTRVNAAGGGFNLFADATRWVTQQLLVKRDRLFMDSFMRTGVWTGTTGIGGGASGTDLTGAATAGSNQFVQFDRSGSDPIGIVSTQVVGLARKTGRRPNTLIMGPDVWNALTQNSSILSRIQYSERGIITEELLRAVFNVDRLIVTWTIENTAPKGATDAIDFMNSKSMLLCYSTPTPGLQEASAGYIFSWTGLLGAGALGTRIKSFRMEELESDRVEGEMAFDMKIVAADLGVYFASVVQ